MCETCEQQALSIHDKTHAFIKIRYPIQSIVKKPLLPKFKELNDASKVTVKEMMHNINEKSSNISQIISKPEEIITLTSSPSSTSFLTATATTTTTTTAPIANDTIVSSVASSTLLPITEPTPNTIFDASFVSDLNIPDGTIIVPKKTFIKAS